MRAEARNHWYGRSMRERESETSEGDKVRAVGVFTVYVRRRTLVSLQFRIIADYIASSSLRANPATLKE